MPKNFKNPYLQSEYNNNDAKYETSNPYLSHGWGNSAAQKQKERDYNRAYYEKHKKDKWGVGLKNHANMFRSAVDESLQKHNENWQRGMDMITGQSRRLARQEEESARRLANHRRTGGAAKNEREKQQANDRNYRYSNIARETARNEASRPTNVRGYYSSKVNDSTDRYGIGGANPKSGSKLRDNLNMFRSAVDESLQKHNENWQRGMDMITGRNKSESSATSIRKMNPYRSTGMADNERSKAAAQRRQNAERNRSNAYAQNEMARRVNQGNSDVLSAVRQEKAAQRRRDNSLARSNAYAQNEAANKAASRSQYESTRRDLQGQARANAYAQSAQANQESARSRYGTVNERMARDSGPSSVLDAVKNAKAENRGRRNYFSGKRANAYAQNEMAKNASNQSQYESTRKGLQEQARANAYAQNEMSRRANDSSELIPQISNQKTAQNVNAYAKNVAKINENINKMTDEYNKADKSIKQLETMYPDILGGRSPIIQKQIDKLKEEKSRLAVNLNEWKQYRNKAQRELEAEKSRLR